MSRRIAPIATLALMPGLALTALGIGAGRGLPIDPKWGLSPVLLGPVGFYLIGVLCGFLIGALTGLIGALFRKVVPAARRASWAETARRSFPTVFRRRKAFAPVVAHRPHPSRRRWAWLAVALLLGAVGAAGGYLGWKVDRRLRDAMAAAARDDPFWSLDDVMAHRAPVPEGENSALVVAELLTRIPNSWPARPRIPWRPAPPPTAFETAFDRLRTLRENLALDREAAEAIRAEMEAHAEAVQIARTVANYQRGKHELEIGPQVIDTPLPETQSARIAANLLRADAAIRVHDGDPDGAIASCCAILGTARSIGDEPFLISQLVRAAIGGEAMKSARRVLGQGEPSDASLARFQTLILDEMAQPLLLIGIKGERAALAEMLQRVQEGKIPISSFGGSALTFLPGIRRDTLMPWDKLMLDHQRAVAIDWMNTAVSIARAPVPERPLLWRILDSEIQRVAQMWHRDLTARLPLSMMPSMIYSDAALSRYQSELGATAVLLAAERHRRKAGEWPTSIAAIDPALLPSPPDDLFSGQAYRMLYRDGQLRVYSPGPDLEDADGAFDIKPGTIGAPDDVGARAWDVELRRQEPG